MNILLVSQMGLNSTTGVTTYYLNLKDEYKKRGHQVVLITPEQTPLIISFFLKIINRISFILNSNFYKLYISEFQYFVSIYYAVKRVRKNKNWHIIHGQDPSSSCAAMFATKNKVPVVTTCHFNDSPLSERQLRYKLSKKQAQKVERWFEFLFSKVHNYIFVSKYTYEKSANTFKNKINYRIINNGVRFYNKKNLLNNSDGLTISNVGTLEDRKNQLLLINAAFFLAKKKLRFKILLFGKGPKQAEWEKEVQEKGLKEHIIFCGHTKNIIEAIEKSDLYVHTAKNEAFCLSITEALSIGLPVLALANGGIHEQFPLSRNGLLASDIDASHLADEIVTCFNLEQRKKMQDEQYEFSSSRFTIESMADKTLDFYNSILI